MFRVIAESQGRCESNIWQSLPVIRVVVPRGAPTFDSILIVFGGCSPRSMLLEAGRPVHGILGGAPLCVPCGSTRTMRHDDDSLGDVPARMSRHCPLIMDWHGSVDDDASQC